MQSEDYLLKSFILRHEYDLIRYKEAEEILVDEEKKLFFSGLIQFRIKLLKEFEEAVDVPSYSFSKEQRNKERRRSILRRRNRKFKIALILGDLDDLMGIVKSNEKDILEQYQTALIQADYLPSVKSIIEHHVALLQNEIQDMNHQLHPEIDAGDLKENRKVA